jgi:hypothetical protein
MKHNCGVFAFASGCVATAAAAWLTVDVGAQRILFDPATSIHACVAADGVMRLTDMSVECPSGQKSLFLKKAEADLELKDQTGQKPKECKETPPVDPKTLADLERRVKELEDLSGRGELGNRVVAPFEVVDRAGKRVFYVSRQGSLTQAELYNSADKSVARMGAMDHGGQFAAEGPDSAVYVGVFSGGAASGLKVLEQSVTRLDLGRDGGTGRYRLKVFGKNGVMVAGIGEEQNSGTGLAVVADAAGKPKANMGIDSMRGLFRILSGEKIIAELTEDEAGAGYLSLRNSGGEKMVGAGVHNGVGFVSTGPNAFKPGMGLLGLPSSYIAGKQ